MNKPQLIQYAKENSIPNYSRLTSLQLRDWILEWESFTSEEQDAYIIPLKLLKYYAVERGLTNVQCYTKKTKIDLVRRIISED